MCSLKSLYLVCSIFIITTAQDDNDTFRFSFDSEIKQFLNEDDFKLINEDVDKFLKKENNIVAPEVSDLSETESIDISPWSWAIPAIFAIAFAAVLLFILCIPKLKSLCERRNVITERILVIVATNSPEEPKENNTTSTTPPPSYEEAVVIPPLPTLEEIMARRQNIQNQA